jgi:hypothetical protein
MFCIFGLQFSSSDLIAITSAFVAVCALGVAVWTGWVTRQHNVLSVRPRIEVIVDGRDPRELLLTAKNVGLGPALITAVHADLGGSTVQLNSQESYRKLVAHFVKSGKTRLQYFVIETTTGLSAAESVTLLRVTFDEPGTQLPHELVSALGAIRLTIDYECMYGTEYHSETPRSAA